MAVRVTEHLLQVHESLRVEPTPKRVRAVLHGEPAVDTGRAVLVWEPLRVVPQYAVPLTDVRADLLAAAPDAGDRSGPPALPVGPGGRSVLVPGTGFGVHSADGTPMTVRLDGDERAGAAFRPADPDLEGYVVLDFAAFDAWFEEDEEILSHPRDPFHRVDVRQGSRRVQLELDGHVLADSARPSLVFETNLPLRWYLPPEDVDLAMLGPSDTTTACAYKGVASYRSLSLPDRTVPDAAWTYPAPLPDAVQLTNLVCFFTERVDVTLDGVAQERLVSPWS